MRPQRGRLFRWNTLSLRSQRRLQQRLNALATIGCLSEGGVRRIAYSDDDLAARQWVMIFVPSWAGVSHAEDEFTSPEQCGQGANVLLHTLLRLDSLL